MFTNGFNGSMIKHDIHFLSVLPEFTGHSRRGRRKHALLPDSLKITAQHVNLSSERQWISGKKQAYEERLMRGMHLF